MSAERLDEILRSHLVEPSLLRTDSFGDFISHRASRLLDVIEAATGKQVSGRDSEETIQSFGGPLLTQAKT